MRNKAHTIPAVVTVFACIFVLLSCGGDDNPVSSSSARVTGSLTVPASAADKSFTVYVDTDTNPLNGSIRTCGSSCGGSTTSPYALNDVPGGLYYVYGIIRVNSINGMPLVAGDLIGYYGGTGVDPPDTPNASVPSSGTVAFNLVLVIIP